MTPAAKGPKGRYTAVRTRPGPSKVSGAIFGLSEPGPMSAVIKVAVDDYVPPGIQRRMAIGPRLFTSRIVEDQVAALDADPNVVEVEIGQPVGPAEGGS